jgi:predicted nucleic acid-binding protein
MKVFIDSSILIEFEKGTKTDLLTTLIAQDYQLYINSIVVSEYLYKLLAILAGKSPMALNESKGIKTTLDKHQTKDFLVNFDYLPIPESAILLSIDLMKKYNLLPNDAQILATCKIYDIAILASFDSDFAVACNAENITLISKTEQLF